MPFHRLHDKVHTLGTQGGFDLGLFVLFSTACLPKPTVLTRQSPDYPSRFSLGGFAYAVPQPGIPAAYTDSSKSLPSEVFHHHHLRNTFFHLWIPVTLSVSLTGVINHLWRIDFWKLNQSIVVIACICPLSPPNDDKHLASRCSVLRSLYPWYIAQWLAYGSACKCLLKTFCNISEPGNMVVLLVVTRDWHQGLSWFCEASMAFDIVSSDSRDTWAHIL